MTGPDLAAAAGHAAAMLAALGIEGVDDVTPIRFVRALDELAAGRALDPTRHLSVEFPPVSKDPGLVVVTDLPFVSLCEHHLLPFTGVVTVGYLPSVDAPIVGLSKLARLVQEYAARPQVQERLTEQIATALDRPDRARGAACAVRGVHSCMALRGARTGDQVAMVTTQYLGALARDPYRSHFDGRLTGPAWQS